MGNAAEFVKLVDSLMELNEDLRVVLQQSMSIIDRAIDLFSLKGIAFSFNGGKDSTIVFHLLRLVLAKRIVDEDKNMNDCVLEEKLHSLLQEVKIMYFDSDEDFPEVREFIEETSKQYSLKYRIYSCSYIEGLKQLLAESQVKAILMGVREGDPKTVSLEHYSPSSKGWPPFMRINPILRWNYSHVWTFLRKCNLSYCKLYDAGYTSLGSIHSTSPNPALRLDSIDSSNATYLPAYELKDFTLERHGRILKKCSSTDKVQNTDD